MSKAKETTAQAVTVEARAYPLAEPKDKLVANASVTIGGIVAIHGIRVFDGDKGLFAAMPSAKVNGEYKDIAHPVTGDLRKQLNAAVVAAYKEALAEKEQEKASVTDQIKAGAKGAGEKTTPAKTRSTKKDGPEH